MAMIDANRLLSGPGFDDEDKRLENEDTASPDFQSSFEVKPDGLRIYLVLFFENPLGKAVLIVILEDRDHSLQDYRSHIHLRGDKMYGRT